MQRRWAVASPSQAAVCWAQHPPASAFLQSIMPAPLFSRSSFTSLGDTCNGKGGGRVSRLARVAGPHQGSAITSLPHSSQAGSSTTAAHQCRHDSSGATAAAACCSQHSPPPQAWPQPWPPPSWARHQPSWRQPPATDTCAAAASASWDDIRRAVRCFTASALLQGQPQCVTSHPASQPAITRSPARPACPQHHSQPPPTCMALVWASTSAARSALATVMPSPSTKRSKRRIWMFSPMPAIASLMVSANAGGTGQRGERWGG